MQAYGFVYIWRDRKRKMFYVGSHHGPENDGYTGSGKRFKSAYVKRPEDFKRRVIERNYVDDPKLTRQMENRWLQMIKLDELVVKYYNFIRHSTGCVFKQNRTKETRAKMRAAALGRRHSPETCAKISAIQLGKTLTDEHKAKLRITSTGKKHTEEAKAKIQAAHSTDEAKAKKRTDHLGRKHTEVARANMRAAKLGKKHTEETKEKIRAVKLGGKHSSEHCAKISEGNLGRKHSDETKAKQRLAKLGKKFSDEHRANLRASHLGKKPSEETLMKRRIALLGKSKGKIWVNNGVSQSMVLPDKIPEGWQKGTLRGQKLFADYKAG